MTETTPVPFGRAYTAADVERLVRRRTETLAGELAEEMRHRALAEAEADDARELARDLQTRLAWTETDRDRLLRALGSRLLQGAAPFVLSGLVGGFACVVLLRALGW